MIQYVFKPSRKKNGKTTKARLYSGRLRLAGETTIRTIPLKTADKQVAEAKLSAIVRDMEREAVGIVPPRIQRDAAQRPLESHLENYLADLKAKELSKDYIYNVEKRLQRLFKECDWQRHTDATADSFIAWRAKNAEAAATTKNQYLEACSAFFKWMKQAKRLLANPFEDVAKVAEEGNERRKRRAYDDDQLKQVLAVAGAFRVGYLAAVHTGFRRAELKAWEWQNVNLENDKLHVSLAGKSTKNKKYADLPLHPELARELKRVKPADAQPSDKVFSNQTLPSMHMVRKHLAQAGIPYKDAEGRQADFHALRHTLATNLAKSNVPVRVAMKMMRHSDIRLTTQTYTDSTRLPLTEAVNALPGFLPTDEGEENDAQIDAQTPDFEGQKLSPGVTDDDEQFLWQIVRNKSLGRELSRDDATRLNRVMAASLGLEGSGKPCKLEAWRVASAQIDAQSFGALCREAAEIVRKWPILTEDLRAGILAMMRSAKGG